jgi:hypothetical protein
MSSNAGSHRRAETLGQRLRRSLKPALGVAITGAVAIALVATQGDGGSASNLADSGTAADQASAAVGQTPVLSVPGPQKVVKGSTVGRLTGPKARQLRLAAQRAAQLRRGVEGDTTFRVGTFNILGSQHTAPGGVKNGFPGAAARMPGSIERIKAHNVSVLGLQEAQPDQLSGLVSGTGFAIYPDASTPSLDRVNSIIYDTEVWSFVSGTTFQMTNGRGTRAQPVLRLEHKVTGQQVMFVNAHPPAGRDARTTSLRAGAQALLVRVIADLRTEGIPVVLTGDMNDREAFVARVIRPAGLVSSFTGGAMPVDWVVATPDITFTTYTRDTSTVSRRISDHYFISATAVVQGS